MILNWFSFLTHKLLDGVRLWEEGSFVDDEGDTVYFNYRY